MLSFSIARHAGGSPHIQMCLDEKGLELLRKIKEARAHGHTRIYVAVVRDALSDKSPWGIPSVGQVIVDWVEGYEDTEVEVSP